MSLGFSILSLVYSYLLPMCSYGYILALLLLDLPSLNSEFKNYCYKDGPEHL